MIDWSFMIRDELTGFEFVIDEPENFSKDFTIEIKRDRETHGVFFENSLNTIKITGIAADRIKQIFESQGIEANTTLTITLSCREDEIVDEIVMKLDYGSYSYTCGNECAVTIGLEQTGCVPVLRARMDTKIDIDSINDLAGELLPTSDNLGFSMELAARDIYLKNESRMLLDTDGVTRLPLIEDLRDSADWYDNIVPLGMQAHLSPAFPDTSNSGLGEYNASITPQLYNGGANNIPNLNMPPTVEFLQQYDIDCDYFDTEVSFRLKGMVEQTSPAAGSTTTMQIKIFTILPGLDDTIPGNFVQEYTQSIASLSGTSDSDVFDVETTVSISAVEGMRLWFSVFILSGGSVTAATITDMDWTQDAECYLQISSSIRCESSEVQSYMIHELLSRVTQSITDQCLDGVISNYYGRTDSTFYPTGSVDGCGSLRIMTNGLKIRKAQVNNWFVSLRELFNGLKCIDNIGMGIEETDTDVYALRIEEAPYFYDDDFEIFALDYIPSLEERVTIDEYYQNIKIGYKKWETNFASGLDEFNSTREYRTNLKTINNSIDLESNIITGSYPIEQTRRESFAETGAADTKYDNDPFLICVIRGEEPVYVTPEYGIIASNNILPRDSTVINARVSPIRNLLRWYKTLSASYADPSQAGSELKFAAGTGNYVAEIEHDRSLGCINEIDTYELPENLDIFYTLFDTAFLGYDDPGGTGNWKVFKAPRLATFEYPMSLKMYRLLKLAPYGYINFSCGDIAEGKKGFISSIKFKPGEGMAQFELIPEFVINNPM